MWKHKMAENKMNDFIKKILRFFDFLSSTIILEMRGGFTCSFGTKHAKKYGSSFYQPPLILP